MRRVFLMVILIAGITAAYGFADMGRERMSDEGHMGQGMMGGQGRQQTGNTSYSGEYPCKQGMMGYGGYGMMGPGMMSGGHMGGMMGPGMMSRGYTGGMMGYGGHGASAYSSEAYRKYLDDTVGLRKKLHNMKFDYYEAVRKQDTKRENLLKIEKKIMDLQWEIYEKSPR